MLYSLQCCLTIIMVEIIMVEAMFGGWSIVDTVSVFLQHFWISKMYVASVQNPSYLGDWGNSWILCQFYFWSTFIFDNKFYVLICLAWLIRNVSLARRCNKFLRTFHVYHFWEFPIHVLRLRTLYIYQYPTTTIKKTYRYLSLLTTLHLHGEWELVFITSRLSLWHHHRTRLSFFHPQSWGDE